MTAPRYRSAWDDAEQPVPDVERVSENVARGAEPIRKEPIVNYVCPTCNGDGG